MSNINDISIDDIKRKYLKLLYIDNKIEQLFKEKCETKFTNKKKVEELNQLRNDINSLLKDLQFSLLKEYDKIDAIIFDNSVC